MRTRRALVTVSILPLVPATALASLADEQRQGTGTITAGGRRLTRLLAAPLEPDRWR
jgi:hypothetical protein